MVNKSEDGYGLECDSVTQHVDPDFDGHEVSMASLETVVGSS